LTENKSRSFQVFLDSINKILHWHSQV
jgi:hypothetical protein